MFPTGQIRSETWHLGQREGPSSRFTVSSSKFMRTMPAQVTNGGKSVAIPGSWICIGMPLALRLLLAPPHLPVLYLDVLSSFHSPCCRRRQTPDLEKVQLLAERFMYHSLPLLQIEGGVVSWHFSWQVNPMMVSQQIEGIILETRRGAKASGLTCCGGATAAHRRHLNGTWAAWPMKLPGPQVLSHWKAPTETERDGCAVHAACQRKEPRCAKFIDDRAGACQSNPWRPGPFWPS